MGRRSERCVTGDDDYTQRAMVAAAVTAGKIEFDDASAAQCLANLEFPATCAAFFTDYDWPDTCYDALSGTVVDGQACTTYWECGGDDSDCVAGTCAPVVEALIRESRRDRR